MRKIQSLFLVATLLLSSGCIGTDPNDDDLIHEPCTSKNLDADLFGEWEQHRHPDQPERQVMYEENGLMDSGSTDSDFADLLYCWTTLDESLITGYRWIDQGTEILIDSLYHVDGDLLFVATISSTWTQGTSVDQSFTDKPTECTMYYRAGVYDDRQVRNDAINATSKPNFCTWIQADPTGASPTDAWAATYLATDHSDVVSTATDDSLMTIELDNFYGELEWYVSEGYFGFWTEITIDNTIHQCSSDSSTNCTITFSGVDDYYAVWEEGEIATLSENGVDICSTTCDIEISELRLREEDHLPGTTQLSIT